MKVCIIGGVAGGATAAARLRRLDEAAQIILFERGEYISFANCGLPYHISGRIKERRSLLLQTPERFWSRFRVEVRISNEVLFIDTEQKRLEVKNRKTGEQYTESYDCLILSPGSYPVVPPIEGSGASMFMNLYDIPGMDAIISRIENHPVKEAVVIGGGFIGVEIAENLIDRGIKTHLVEMLSQVMTPFDPEMANIIHARLAAGGICLHLSDGVKKIIGDKQGKVVLDSGTELDAELVVSAVGVRPEIRLAEEAGLKIGPTGGIAVDSAMKTSDPFIYAVGDAVETIHLAGWDAGARSAGGSRQQTGPHRRGQPLRSGFPLPGIVGNVHRQSLRFAGGGHGAERKNGREKSSFLSGHSSPSQQPCRILPRCRTAGFETSF